MSSIRTDSWRKYEICTTLSYMYYITKCEIISLILALIGLPTLPVSMHTFHFKLQLKQ